MQFNPNTSKQGKKVYFSKKANNVSSLPVTFNKTNAVTCYSQKELGLVLDQQLNFNDHIQSKMSKCYKMIGITKRLSVSIPRDALFRIHKSFIRPHLDHGDIIHDKPNNKSFKSKIESVRYKACMAIYGVIQGTSPERL